MNNSITCTLLALANKRMRMAPIGSEHPTPSPYLARNMGKSKHVESGEGTGTICLHLGILSKKREGIYSDTFLKQTRENVIKTQVFLV